MKLSLIMPAYNEENRILKPLSEYHSFFKKKLKNNFEIIVVPNNCKDNTEEVVRRFAKNKKNIRIFNIPNYSGKGGAVMQGFKLAKGDLIGFVDADESTSPEEFNKLYENINGFDGIIGSRKIKGATIFPKRKLKQDLSSFLFNLIVRVLFNLKFKDTQCGAKLFKKDLAKLLSEKYTKVDWMFDVNLLYLCKKNNSKILEYPINWTDSEGSKLILKEQITTIMNLIKYRFETIFS